MVNFYRKFIPQCAKILAPLNSLLQGIPAGRNANLSWSEEASTAFEDIKVALSNATLPNFPQHDSPTTLFVDENDKFCGAVLSPIDSSGSHRPLEYFSAAFSDAQKRYSTFLFGSISFHIFLIGTSVYSLHGPQTISWCYI